MSALLTLLLAALPANRASAAGLRGERSPPAWLLQLDAGPGAAIVERHAPGDAGCERDGDSLGDGDAAALSAPRGFPPSPGRARPPLLSSAAAPRAAWHAFRARAPPAS
ncbi:MAG: hypothetical protein ACT4N8_04910 [Sphingosinicella sp.]